MAMIRLMSSRSLGPAAVLRRLLFALVTAGVVLGVWRWLGNGTNVTDAGWFGHVIETLTDFGTWSRDRISQLGDRVQ